jgi:molybdopterin-guanine dinucleotide biosynthesis protein A
MAADVIGAVLAGGRGRRIGGDKPSLELGDKTLVRHAVSALCAAGVDVALVLRPGQPVPLAAHTIAVVRDEIEDAGPLGGLQSLLRWLPVEWALVAACDQPFLSPRLLQSLMNERRDGIEAICARPSDRLEPLPGLYHRSVLPAIDGALERGARSLLDLLGSLRVREVPRHLVELCDPSLASFLNINTLDELERARALEASQVGQQQSKTSAGTRR